MKKDLDWSNVVADANRGDGIMFGKDMTATELKHVLTDPKGQHAIPEQFVEDFFEFANAVHCDISVMAFYRWYRLPSMTTAEWDIIAEALRAHRAMLHLHLNADIRGEDSDLVTLEGHKETQRQAETITSLINRLALCNARDEHNLLWCTLDRHQKDVPHRFN